MADSKFVAPALMLGFGLLSGAFGVSEFARLRANPAPLTIACNAAAIEDAPDDRWVVLESCEPLLDDIFEVKRGSDVDALIVPLRAPGAAANEPPVAVLTVSDASVINAYEALPDADASQENFAEAADEFLTKLDVGRVEGVTATRYGEANDSRFTLLRQRYTLPEAGVVSIQRGRVPKLPMVLICLGATLLLIPLGIVFFLRAHRQPPTPQAPLPPGLPR